MKKKLIEFAKEMGLNVSMLISPYEETSLLALGKMLSNQQYSMNSTRLQDYEFKIYSQWGDDGIIQYLIKNLKIDNDTFIEFGVENYLESNTRFLMMNNNWSGFIIDGSEEAISSIKKRRWFWKYALTPKCAFIDRENINELLNQSGFKDLGLLHIDIDGNDYYILDEIDFSIYNPSILILEYNSVFGNERKISVPYDPKFQRGKAHFSYLYFGASLPALTYLANKKGYALIGCTSNGNNAYYVRRDLLNDKVKEVALNDAYVSSKFKEGRNKDYSLSQLEGEKRLESLRGLDIFNVETQQIEKL